MISFISESAMNKNQGKLIMELINKIEKNIIAQKK
jgi:hypothetical protein